MKWICLALALCAMRAPALTLDREAFTFTKYVLEVKVEPEQHRIGVRGKVRVRNDSALPQKYICLQLSSSLNWRAVQIEDKPVEFTAQTYTSDIDHTGALSEAIVTLPREVPAKGVVEISVGYEGVIVADTTRLERIGIPKEVAKHSDWDEIGRSFTAVRGVGHVTWYPVGMEAANLSEGNSVAETVGRWKRREAESEMTVTAEYSSENSGGGLKCTGNALPKQSEKIHSGNAECSFSPMGLSAPGFAGGDYLPLDRPGIDIEYFPEEKPAAETFASAAEAELPFVTEWFGAPRLNIQIFELGDSHDSPFESGISLMTPLVQLDPKKYSSTAVHQLTHAAFPSSRLWIYEGLAHFAQAASVEKDSGRRAALDFMAPHIGGIISAEKSTGKESVPARAAGDSLINTSAEEFYRSKAMYVWWMLRDMVGEDKLKAALADYRFGQDKEPSYMQRLIEVRAKADLEWFFDDWVYRDRGLPDFRVESAYARKLLNGSHMVTVTVENLGDAGAEVPVTLRMQAGTETRRLVVRGKSKASIRIEAASIPLEITVNDGSIPESDLSNNNFKIVLPVN